MTAFAAGPVGVVLVVSAAVAAAVLAVFEDEDWQPVTLTQKRVATVAVRRGLRVFIIIKINRFPLPTQIRVGDITNF